jgi:hypothetical protein
MATESHKTRSPSTRAGIRAFSPTTDYKQLDIVVLNGASFVARHDNPGPCPGAGWQMVASQGKRGVKGEKGQRGPPGQAIASWKFRCERYTVVPVMSDGTHGAPLELHNLFQQFLNDTNGT